MYEEAPVAVSVELLPIQTAVGVANVAKVGTGTTVKLALACAVQPAADAPVIVYMVVDDGPAVIAEPVNAPGFQV